MSELTYKKIIDVETIETLNDAATVFINDNGAMKQVAADKFGAVKTVNGVEPDENGNIESYHSVSFNFADGSAIVPGLITYYGTETMAELCDYYAQSAVYNVECRRMIMTNGGTMQSRNCIGNEVVKDADGNVTGHRLFFGDDLCPVILDIASNKIIFDPDWVKPENNNSIEPIFININALDQVSLTFDEAFALSVPELATRLCMYYGDSQYGYSVTNVMKNNTNTWGPHICWEWTELFPTRDSTINYSTKYYIWTEFSIQELPLAK